MDHFTVSGATLFTPFVRIPDATLEVEAGRIQRVGGPEQAGRGEHIDGRGLYLVPGLIELQINGAFGLDFTAEPESIWRAARDLPRFGVTRFLPTLVTSPLERADRAQAALLAGAPPGYRGALPLGLHLEGPYLNPERKGAHRAEFLRLPSLAEVESFTPARGVRLVTLAPELPGALEMIRELAVRGVVVSAAHSMANLEQARQGFQAGLRYATHLFNTMPPLSHFDPGLVGAVLSEPEWIFGIIADGIHIHPTLVSLVWKLAGPGRMTLVSDAMAALGQGPGRYPLGEQKEIIVDETSARLPDGVLAGSILAQNTALRNLMAFTGCTLEEALTCMTSTPADLLGMRGEIGTLEPGCRADFVLMTPDLEVVQVYVEGQKVYHRPERN
jgi:N-acetylglucosamine-6-phosphate deacetylase